MSTPQQRVPAVLTLAQTLEQGRYRDIDSRAFFGVYVANYHKWIASQAEVHTDSQAVIALVGALIDNPEVRRAFIASRAELERLVQVLEEADRRGQGLKHSNRPLQQFADGTVGFEGSEPAQVTQRPAPPPPPPAPPPPVAENAPPASPEPAPKQEPPKPSEIRELGRKAHDAGVLLTDCPYPGELGDAWEDGWREARQAARASRPRGEAGDAPPAPAPAAPTPKPPKKPRSGGGKKKPATDEATA
jgi:hypothetical protein